MTKLGLNLQAGAWWMELNQDISLQKSWNPSWRKRTSSKPTKQISHLSDPKAQQNEPKQIFRYLDTRWVSFASLTQAHTKIIPKPKMKPNPDKNNLEDKLKSNPQTKEKADK